MDFLEASNDASRLERRQFDIAEWQPSTLHLLGGGLVSL